MVRRVRNLTESINITDFTGDIMTALAETAIKERNRVIVENRPSSHRVWVGGRPDASEYSVRLGETIRYEFAYMKEIAIDAMRVLKKNSPEQTGPDRSGKPPDQYKYKDAHFIIADGQAYQNAELLPDDVSAFTITNVMPYARKVEIHGWKGVKHMTLPYHTYERSLAELKKYGNIVKVSFEFIEMPGFAVGPNARARTLGKQVSATRYPGLKFSLLY